MAPEINWKTVKSTAIRLLFCSCTVIVYKGLDFGESISVLKCGPEFNQLSEPRVMRMEPLRTHFGDLSMHFLALMLNHSYNVNRTSVRTSLKYVCLERTVILSTVYFSNIYFPDGYLLSLYHMCYLSVVSSVLCLSIMCHCRPLFLAENSSILVKMLLIAGFIFNFISAC